MQHSPFQCPKTYTNQDISISETVVICSYLSLSWRSLMEAWYSWTDNPNSNIHHSSFQYPDTYTGKDISINETVVMSSYLSLSWKSLEEAWCTWMDSWCSSTSTALLPRSVSSMRAFTSLICSFTSCSDHVGEFVFVIMQWALQVIMQILLLVFLLMLLIFTGAFNTLICRTFHCFPM